MKPLFCGFSVSFLMTHVLSSTSIVNLPHSVDNASAERQWVRARNVALKSVSIVDIHRRRFFYDVTISVTSRIAQVCDQCMLKR
ncbi:hypothetical protein M8J76_002886 [Diaphorina citri]|nr:hypothetical protein M8J76_002886 [Diaphorina citri]